ncbi:MAG: restriction endonuclease subunit S [Balneolaceae bacterium]|nr:restriction endonuclease subunit S [Balneolaceae bacterium]
MIRSKKEAKNSKWLKDIPNKWSVGRIKDLVNLKSGETITSEEIDEQGDFPVYGGNGQRGYTSSYTHEGDRILIGRQGALCGNINYASGKFWATEHAVVATPVKKFELLWLGELLRIMNLNRYSNAAAQPGLAVERIKNLYIPIPPEEEQKAIAFYLGDACTKIDKVVERKHEQLRKLQQYFFTKVNELLTAKKKEDSGKSIDIDNGFIKRKIPATWTVDRLRDIAIINDESLGANTPDDHLINYLDISNVDRYGVIDRDEIEELLFEEAPSRAKRVVKKYDTVISSVRTNLQAVAYIDFEMKNLICSTGFFVCRPKFTSKLRSKFLYYFLLTTYSKDYFFFRSTGVSYPAINDYKFGSIPMFIPPVNKQDEIIERLDKLKSKIENASKNIRDQIAKLNAYKKSLIHECVTGKKRVYDEKEKLTSSVYAE